MTRTIASLMLLLVATVAQAQINIGGSVYGGARQADVKGRTYVNVGADYHDVVINAVYGGNDIAGTIGSTGDEQTVNVTVPDELELATDNGIDNSYQAFVLVSPEPTETTGEGQSATTSQDHHIFIGQLFGGGNGDYIYKTDEGQDLMEGDLYVVKDAGDNVVATSATAFAQPTLGKTYIELRGGTIAYVYGGGNNATVTQAADICIDNSSEVTTSGHIKDSQNNPLLTPERLRAMGISTLGTNVDRDTYHYSRVFGGNNKADMRIHPTWHLNKGYIENLYSGGNEGRMTSPEGLLLEIPATSRIMVDNVYGGCRKADVCPENEFGNPVTVRNFPGYNFPDELSARVLIRGGDINNVYGGNDITGRVYGGNAVGIYTSIRGSVYGGGNGSYPYTDNPNLKESLDYGDYYYVVPNGASDIEKAQALNAFRPNAEQVSIRLHSPDEHTPTRIGGSVYAGGNSATLKNDRKANPMVELKIGSYVIADNVFLGNNGENMVKNNEGTATTPEGVLVTMGRTIDEETGKVNSMNLTDPAVFAEYMKGCAMDLMPAVVFDGDSESDGDDFKYEHYSTYFGSLFCGGNVGSMSLEGKTTMHFRHEIVVFDKVVGGCNNAYVEAKDGVNAAYFGGLIGSPDDKGDKLELNFEGLKLQPKRWNADKTDLEWNVISASTGQDVDQSTIKAVEDLTGGEAEADDLDRRLTGGHIYGGCYNSGHVNGNVIINLNASVIDRDILFDEVEVEDETGEARLYGNNTYKITRRHTGVLLDKQGMDPLGAALNVFGGGYGENSEVWGSTTINLKRGYTFQIFGGGEKGVIGKRWNGTDFSQLTASNYESRYSTYINLQGATPGVSRHHNNTEDIAEAEFIYGGGFFGLIQGDTHINLGNGRIFNSFAGSCNADILGHTETYVGRNSMSDDDAGFPYIRDHIYGGNDLGGQILGEKNFSERVTTEATPMVYNDGNTTASAYIEYRQGRVDNIFGGCYGYYDYKDPHYKEYTYTPGAPGATEANLGLAQPGFTKPRLGNAFINFRPVTSNNSHNRTLRIYGAGQGYPADSDRDIMQERSYVLIDIPTSMEGFYTGLEVFGAGEYSGVGMGVSKETAKTNANGIEAAAVIDLARGRINAAYGASYQEGITRRTIVNVPAASTIKVNKLFGGGFGTTNASPCDAYEATVNYSSPNAEVQDTIFGGNNNARRTLFGRVNINSAVKSSAHYTGLAVVFGAGLGKDTWSQYTEVNLNPGAMVREVYGGGRNGMVLNVPSVWKWKESNTTLDLTLGNGYDAVAGDGKSAVQADSLLNGLGNDLAQTRSELSWNSGAAEKYNTNVIIHEGAFVGNKVIGTSPEGLTTTTLMGGYCYGGGLGADAVVSGTTYITLLGGTVYKDLYGAGTSGAVKDLFGDKTFTASSNVYIQGGTARNVYGGGWEGSVGHHTGDISNKPTAADPDIDGETHVYIGNLTGNTFTNGVPTIQRNAYGGGEGGPVFGTANLTLYNGYVGYVYDAATGYTEKLDDETWKDHLGINNLKNSGNVFGGGYVDNSSVDFTNVKMYGGTVRNSVFGGGEIAAVGRGDTKVDPNDETIRTLNEIYKAGRTHIEIYKGHVMRDVFGGGKGYDNFGEVGDLFTDGYVFGQTDVHIRGGVIGTTAGVANGYGNVFGGGDVGFVYSQGEKRGKKGDGNVAGGGFYFDPDGTITGTKDKMTIDCNVIVEPWCQVKDGSSVTIAGTTYQQGDYVPVEALNKLRSKNSDPSSWGALDDAGIVIHNAVFAGGNLSDGSDKLEYAKATTVFGNASAALRDVFHRDLITIGTEHTGGLYGDGNLTFVDGYRELHIDNYGTDYYGMSDNITKDEYEKLTDRERAYFELKYKCVKECIDKKGQVHAVNSSLSGDDIRELFVVGENESPYEQMTAGVWDANVQAPSTSYWEETGFCSIYAGRLLNTIQRADMVGIFGSRMVLQGAKDRVPERVDYTPYTINRVGEVSLNQRETQAGDIEEETGLPVTHGNYFGIYSVVNYLGNLTSDVTMLDKRTTDSSNPDNKVDGKTYYEWKLAHAGLRNRNNGTSPNKVALASGVYLEITREEGEGKADKEWGYITGVVELDLIDVKQGLGGGYVYAKNEHRTKTYKPDASKVIMSPYNEEAKTYKKFVYSENSSDIVKVETSGNFIHNVKQIVDDCYPDHDNYQGTNASPAHYWYIRGSIYVYDQKISAYTGAPTAYSEYVNIPLTITAASHGKLTLREVKPNLYAYYDQSGKKLGSEGADSTFLAGTVAYKLNQPISWWSYQLLTPAEQAKFVPQTYVTVKECRIGDVAYPAGYTMLPDEYTTLKTANATVYSVADADNVPFTDIFRLSNNLSHDEGYILTYDVTNPVLWNNWWTKPEGSGITSLRTDQYTDESDYVEGPTYVAKSSGVYGQKDYHVGDIVNGSIYQTYTTKVPTDTQNGSDQAKVERAYIVTHEVETKNKNGTDQHLYSGTAIAQSDYTDEQWAALAASRSEAKVVRSTLDLGDKNYLYAQHLMTQSEVDALKEQYPALVTEIDQQVEDAYICTTEGKYGGNYYAQGQVYRALEAWCSMSKADRENFKFNYDALDLLIDSAYANAYGNKPQYDGYNGTAQSATAQYPGSNIRNPKVYSVTQSIDYEAEYMGAEPFTYTNQDNEKITITPGAAHRISREQYEAIPNEKYHFSPIIVTKPGNYYVVKVAFMRGDVPYTVGQTISEDMFNSLGLDQKANVETIHFAEDKTKQKTTTDDEGHTQFVYDEKGNPVYEEMYYYYCRESFTVGEHGEGHPFVNTGITTGTSQTYNVGDVVPEFIILDATNYDYLPNYQSNFSIHGNPPIETSTLYVSRESNIYDLSQDRIITVVYLYEYEESDESGHNIMPISERHIVNIHVEFKSGVPEISELFPPDIVLPGTTIGLEKPDVKPGAYEVTDAGWEIFTNQNDAESHKNGQPYDNNRTPMYWYQNGYWVAYYAQTYLGKTYSNAVQFAVANYHDLDDVMADKKHHYYIDHKDVDREAKIYLNDYSRDGKNALDLLNDLVDLSHVERTYTTVTDASGNQEQVPNAIADGPLAGHVPFERTSATETVKPMRGGQYLDFILRTDLSHDGAWTPIADDDGECFAGKLHGDGYTISGLDHSLFGHLCGDVYNLGVTGSFKTAGIADTGDGYIENCWITSSATEPSVLGGSAAEKPFPIFGNPTDNIGYQLVNCYYPASNAALYNTATNARGTAIQKPDADFYNGTVAYNLNGFYLNKRYWDKKVPATAGTATTPAGYQAYTYLPVQPDGTLPTTTNTAYYPVDETIKSTYAQYGDLGYVERRFADGDFIYANGSKPEGSNIRQRTVTNGDLVSTVFDPIWPDDYLFFGQTLTYAWNTLRPHQPLPTRINKIAERLPATDLSNRVYRAPAYFRSATMKAFHYNPWANIAAYSKPKNALDKNLTAAYPGMTAVDFAGHGDLLEGNYALGISGTGATRFYPPLLDDDGLIGIANRDETHNLLVYAPSAEANAKTNAVLTDYFVEPAFSDYHDATSSAYTDGKGYNRVATAPTTSIFGHLVPSTLTAVTDHLLVDQQDFNCPVAYSFDDDHRMWYQRTPTQYAQTVASTTGTRTTTGWDAISLPFTVSLVTTQQKGELTHFYTSATDADKGSTGHEYWLRQYRDISALDNTDADGVRKALFSSPESTSTDADYTATSTFLWDYYYSKNTQQDKNTDIYQRYYSDERSYDNYPLQQAATPYILGLPGARYYEFDLSGTFVPSNTYLPAPAQLSQQVVTFASATKSTIGVSDSEIQASLPSLTHNGYTFRPSYLRDTLAVGTAAYALADNGGSFDRVPATGSGVVVQPFRPYFVQTAASGGARPTRSILLMGDASDLAQPNVPYGHSTADEAGTLAISGGRRKVVVTSTLRQPADVTITNAAGITVATFTIEPGQTQETRINQPGVYIVNQKKVSVR